MHPMPNAMHKLLRPLNTIFGRLTLLSVGLLVMMQLTWLVIVDRERAVIEADHVSRLVRLVLDPAASAADGSSERLAAALGLRLVDAGARSAPLGCPPPCADTHGPFETALRADLPPQSRAVFDRSELMWVRYGPSSRWLVIPAVVPPVSRFLSASALMLFLAIAIALLGAWQIQKPVSRLARAAREFRLGHRPPMVLANGPSEVKGLIGDFNEMARELSDAEQERAVMLAGVAHDLRAPSHASRSARILCRTSPRATAFSTTLNRLRRSSRNSSTSPATPKQTRTPRGFQSMHSAGRTTQKLKRIWMSTATTCSRETRSSYST
jgi:two-component system osmolarity sensor histidine kinase EnvZ